MALDSNSWINREQHKSNNEQQQQIFVTDNHHQQQQQRGLLKIPSKSSILTQTERFTQTEYRSNCVESSAPSKEVVIFDPAMQQQPQPNQMYTVVDKKDTSDKASTVAEFPFCYNVNMLQKVHQQQTTGVPATAVGGISGDDKGCYRFDVSQPFGYNYALVNQMSLAAAASSATFKCDVCGLVFGHLSLLNHHKRIHTSNNNPIPSDRNFPCEQPPEAKPQIKSKSKCCNTCGIEMDCEHLGMNKKKGKFVKCENCQTSSPPPTNGGFQSPPQESSPPQEVINKSLHLVKRRGMATVTKCHKCNGSGIIFVGGTRPAGEKPFRCNLCDGSFSRYSSLWSHKRLHTGDKPFKCDMCGLTFARAAYLKNHIRVHSGEKPFKCNVCGMQFSQSPHLKNHERIHSGERPYQCEVCEKTFARHSTLWNHRRIHTGEKPYRCGVCGSAFNQATHLKNHTKVHTGEKPHRCDICEVGFSDRFALKRHRSIHEKYGRTASNGQQQPPPPQQQQQPSQQQQSQQPQQTQPMDELYKCEVGGPIAFPGCSRPQDQQQQQQQPQQQPQQQQQQQLQQQPQQAQQMDELYKCEVGGPIAFPGCSRPQDQKQ